MSICPTGIYVNHLCAKGDQNPMSDPLELELGMIVNHYVEILGAKPRLFARAVSAIDH